MTQQHIAQGALQGATIVFDLDGTLVDSAPDLVGTLNLLLEQEGLPALPLERVRTMIGRGARALIERGFTAAGADLTPARLDALFDRFIDIYEGRIADESVAFPGVFASLGALREAGARLSVCTNKRNSLSVLLLDALEMSSHFDAIVGADAVPACKPDAGHILAAVERAGGDVARAVMVGDSGTDAAAARAAGVPLVLVSFGYTETPVDELGADILIHHFDDLMDACVRLL